MNAGDSDADDFPTRPVAIGLKHRGSRIAGTTARSLANIQSQNTEIRRRKNRLSRPSQDRGAQDLIGRRIINVMAVARDIDVRIGKNALTGTRQSEYPRLARRRGI